MLEVVETMRVSRSPSLFNVLFTRELEIAGQKRWTRNGFIASNFDGLKLSR
jgi:hypothetical protein